MQKVHTPLLSLQDTNPMAAPDIRLIHPDNPKVAVCAWTTPPSPTIAMSAMAISKGRVFYKNKGFFTSEAVQLIELTLKILRQLDPDLPLSPHLLNYLAECEQSRKNKQAP